MQIDLTGKLAVVTGASGDLGRVIAKTLGECGADVVLTYLHRREPADVVAEQLRKSGRRALVAQADVTHADGVNRLRDFVVEQLGVADIIVNNAVSQYQWKSILEQPAVDYEGQFRSSVLHNVLMAQAFVPGMIAKKFGRVIGINTECAMQCHPGQSAYISGKRGMDGVLRVLAREVGPHNITVNQVAPGWMISERDRSTGTEKQPSYEAPVPMKRRGHDVDIANAVAFLASDLANFISGVYLPVCGGNVMPGI